MKLRSRLPFGDPVASKTRSRPYAIALGLTGVGFIVLMAALSWRAPENIPARPYYTIQAAFQNADHVTPHSQVRLGGKLVGQILDPHIVKGQAVVDIQMDPKYGPLRSDTRIEVRPRSAVGVRYVEILPGTRGTKLAEGARIPASQTSATTPLDEVLDTFPASTRKRTQALLRALGTGLAGRGDDLNAALDSGPKMLRGTGKVLGAVTARPGAVRSLINGLATATDAFYPVRHVAAQGFKPEAAALRPFSNRAASVRATLAQAPSALATLRDRLPQVNPLVTRVKGFSANLRDALATAPASFGQASALLRESGPALRDADGTLRLAGRAVGPVLALLDTARPVLPDLESGLRDALPVLATLGDHGCDFINWGVRWGSMMSFGNSAGGVLRFKVMAPTAESALGAGDALKGNPLYAVNDNPYPAPCTAGEEKLGG